MTRFEHHQGDGGARPRRVVRSRSRGDVEVSRQSGGGDQDPEQAAGDASRVLTYLTSVFHGQYPPDECGLRTSREMATLARALDALRAGSLPEVADLFMQRLEALECSIVQGDWQMAEHIEVIPKDQVGLATQDEKRAAQKQQIMEARLRESKTARKH